MLAVRFLTADHTWSKSHLDSKLGSYQIAAATAGNYEFPQSTLNGPTNTGLVHQL